jgi:hypothetical protein
MFINIKQAGMDFVYRKKHYHTPVELGIDKESLAVVISKLHKQNITDYVISPKPMSQYKIHGKQVKQFISDTMPVPIKEKKKKTNIVGMLNSIIEKQNTIESHILNIPSNQTVVYDSVKKVSGKHKTKDTNKTFIPEIDTKGMKVKSNVKTEKIKINLTVQIYCGNY